MGKASLWLVFLDIAQASLLQPPSHTNLTSQRPCLALSGCAWLVPWALILEFAPALWGILVKGTGQCLIFRPVLPRDFSHLCGCITVIHARNFQFSRAGRFAFVPYWLEALQRLGLTAKLKLARGRFMSENLPLRELSKEKKNNRVLGREVTECLQSELKSHMHCSLRNPFCSHSRHLQ